MSTRQKNLIAAQESWFLASPLPAAAQLLLPQEHVACPMR
jgi:hypothetical protein